MTLPPARRIFLYPFEWLYCLMMRKRRAWYESHPDQRFRASVPVISVGNLSMGGTGKTPMAIWLMEYYRSMGKRPAYLSRGYGRKQSGYILLESGHHARAVGDEALMVALRFPDLPVAVCESRATGIRHLMQEKPDLIILDDAFQHLKVHRDMDLLMMDANRMPDEDFPLPGGRLREPLDTLGKADMLVINKITSVQQWNRLRLRLAPWGKQVFGTQFRASSLARLDGAVDPLPETGQSAILFSALGNNDSFRLLAESLGLKVEQHLTYRDHHFYTRKDLQQIWSLAQQQDEALLLTSEKDLVRLIRHPEMTEDLASRVRAVTVELTWMDQDPGSQLSGMVH